MLNASLIITYVILNATSQLAKRYNNAWLFMNSLSNQHTAIKNTSILSKGFHFIEAFNLLYETTGISQRSQLSK